MFKLPEAWVWDFWTVDDGDRYHLFFLYASRALRDPHARHYRASVGHAVSSDLVSWERVADALVRSDAPAFDDLATWTGSVVRHPDGRWFMFYTGATLDPSGANLQSIGYATSTDLVTWDKAPGPVLAADPRWYEKLSDGLWHDEAFRDPWVVADPDGDGWHMLITARANHGEAFDRGVVGHAWSPDLETWELLPPLSEPVHGFGQLEVFQTADVDGRHVLLFNCLAEDTSAARRATGTTGGIWVTEVASPLGPINIGKAQQLTDDSLYVGKFVTDRETGETKFLAFLNASDDGFVGEISDPMLASWDGPTLVLSPVRERVAVP
ncbi:glycosyl hydrolase family 32 [Intrasporangium oryzae NRRL B-24470]|uniref:beta-fructofuranosidase n=1 Tax=Intrasporangium oryzae NRRL B-24470 TaxID=1386089 RepID=W9G969_9MICO|nr:glycosyl hydrolase family 32 [Intrasporangium oryzae]EWT00409.1 glycosyl hydrolase family 32 [Intrasporangium oryzae NRRL B-24470]